MTIKVWSLGTFDREGVEEMIGQSGVFLLSDGNPDEMRAIGGLIGERVQVVPENGVARDLARLRARVLGIDPYADPVGCLKRLQSDLSIVVEGTACPSSGAAKGGE